MSASTLVDASSVPLSSSRKIRYKVCRVPTQGKSRKDNRKRKGQRVRTEWSELDEEFHGPDMCITSSYSEEQLLMNFRTKVCNHGCNKDPEVCFFSHARKPQRRVPYLKDGVFSYIPRMCEHMEEDNVCPNGDNCKSSHSWLEVIFHPLLFRTKPCNHLRNPETGLCEGRGIYCAKAHKKSEIRSLVAIFGEDWKELYGGYMKPKKPKEAKGSKRSHSGHGRFSRLSNKESEEQPRYKRPGGRRTRSKNHSHSRYKKKCDKSMYTQDSPNSYDESPSILYSVQPNQAKFNVCPEEAAQPKKITILQRNKASGLNVNAQVFVENKSPCQEAEEKKDIVNMQESTESGSDSMDTYVNTMSAMSCGIGCSDTSVRSTTDSTGSFISDNSTFKSADSNSPTDPEIASLLDLSTSWFSDAPAFLAECYEAFRGDKRLLKELYDIKGLVDYMDANEGVFKCPPRKSEIDMNGVELSLDDITPFKHGVIGRRDDSPKKMCEEKKGLYLLFG